MFLFRKAVLSSIFFISFFGGAVNASAETRFSADVMFGRVMLYVDGAKVKKETLLYDGRVYLPLRAAADALGKNVTYDAKTQTAYIEGDSDGRAITDYETLYAQKKIDAVMGRVQLVVDGKKISEDTILYDGATFVPLRSTADALGKDVYYDDVLKTVYLGQYYTDSPGVPDFGTIFGVTLLEKTGDVFGGYFYRYDASLDLYHKYIARLSAERFANYERTDGSIKISETEFIRSGLFVAVTYDYDSGSLSVLAVEAAQIGENDGVWVGSDDGSFYADHVTVPPPITMAAYREIKVGMTFEEVRAVTGNVGKLMFSGIGADGVTLVTSYQWRPEYGLYVSVIFGDGIVTNKNWN